MQKADVLADIYQKRGAKGLPLERVYRHLFNPEFYLRARAKAEPARVWPTPCSINSPAIGQSLK